MKKVKATHEIAERMKLETERDAETEEGDKSCSKKPEIEANLTNQDHIGALPDVTNTVGIALVPKEEESTITIVSSSEGESKAKTILEEKSVMCDLPPSNRHGKSADVQTEIEEAVEKTETGTESHPKAMTDTAVWTAASLTNTELIKDVHNKAENKGNLDKIPSNLETKEAGDVVTQAIRVKENIDEQKELKNVAFVTPKAAHPATKPKNLYKEMKGLPENTTMYFKMSATTKPGDARLLPFDAKMPGKFGKDKGVQFPEQKKVKEVVDYDIPDEGNYDVYTGMMSDGRRRVDYVLVINATEKPKIKNLQTEFLVNLVKLGLIVEVENGTLKQYRHLQFVKLHAPDLVLDEYADTFRVRKLFRDNHTQYIHNYKGTFWYRTRCFRKERECILAVRDHYIQPLKLSNLDRSYIVYLLLRCQPFGAPVNYCGLQRLLDKKVILDGYALHDGPYFISGQQKYNSFNCRQILYFHWAGYDNMFKYQPLNLVNEYCGSKLAFYFTFYEFYNKALVVASMWGLFITVVYLIKDSDYLADLRNRTCYKAGLKFQNYADETTEDIRRTWIPQGPECVGVGRDARCPVKYYFEQCADLGILRLVDSPYVILYSFGMSLWALLFLVFWTRVQSYWIWLWEEGYLPSHKLLRPEYEQNIPEDPKEKVTIKKKIKTKLYKCLVSFCRFITSGFLLPLLAYLLLLVLVFGYIYGYVEWIRPLSTSLWDPEGKSNITGLKYTPKINRSLDFLILAVVTFIICGLVYSLEQLFYFLSNYATKLENHRTRQKFEESLILKYFSYSFIYGSIFVVYYAWLKGFFYVSPIEVTDMIINLTTPWHQYSVNVTRVGEGLRNISLRFLTWNCGGNFSCFREAVVVYFVTIFFRTVCLGLVEVVWDLIMDWVNLRKVEQPEVPTAEREFLLRPVTELDVVRDFNQLMLQFALVSLFTPLFPLAPLIAFLNNFWHLRSKAKAYVMSCRRVVLFRTKGIGYWNMIVKLICFATPLFHALTLTQTEIFKKYAFYKKPRDPKTVDAFTEQLLGEDSRISLFKYTTAKSPVELVLLVNRKEDVRQSIPYWDGNIDDIVYPKTEKTAMLLSEYIIDGVVNHVPSSAMSIPYPFDGNYMRDNRTNSYFKTEHYYAKYLKVVFVLVFVVVVSTGKAYVQQWNCSLMKKECGNFHNHMWLVVWLWLRRSLRPRAVTSRARRERSLRRLHTHYLKPPPAARAVCDLHYPE